MISPAEEELLNNLREGKCTDEELDTAFSLVHRLPEDRALSVMEDLWKYSHYRKTLPPATYQKILRRIDGSEARVLPFYRRYLPWLTAASVLLLLLAGWWFFAPGPTSLTATTAFAEQKTLTLPDGTTVWLNANSTLTYPENWDDAQDRLVTLTGEAFFRVTPRPATGQKFLVRTPDLTVSVLGTVFNVNSREEQTSVFLEEGRIALQLAEDTEAEKVMEPGDLVTYSGKRKQLIQDKKAPTPAVHTSWKDGVLVFDDTPLLEVLDKVENIYGITFEVPDTTIYGREITAGLPMEELSIVLPLLEQVLGYPIVEDGGRYVIME